MATWFIPGKSPIRVSNLHRAVAIDAATGRVVCQPGGSSRVRMEVFEYWPSDIQRLFQQAGLPRRAPPAVDCDAGDPDPGAGKPRIRSPITGAAYVIRSSQAMPPEIPLQASLDASAREIHWFADETYLGSAAASAPLAWSPHAAGRYVVRAIDDHGRSDSREIRVDIER